MTRLQVETWTWYSVTWLIVFARLSSRVMLLGSPKKLQSDDWIMMFAMACDTVLMVTINIVATTNSNLINPADHVVLTPEEISTRAYGSKMVLVVEQMQIAIVWSVKVCLLLMYNRLTMSLKQNWAVRFLSIYVIMGFIIMEVLYFGVWCRPFNQYWAVPPQNAQCSTAMHHLITNAVFNISSDIIMIMIPMPIFIQSQIPLKQKAVLCSVFALGIFTILSAILNKYYSFTDPYGASWTFWYIRESSTALIVSNLPLTWSLFRRVLNLTSLHGRSSHQTGSHHLTTAGYHSHVSHIQASCNRDDISEAGLRDISETNNSQEMINKNIPLKIYQKHEVKVTSQLATKEDIEAVNSAAITFQMHPNPAAKESWVPRNSDGGDSSSEKSAEGAVKAYNGV
ncbi:hypothetical protein TD95_001232 [Thielaviopsis punctulata]|uniref:Rhodopsin domain-containing protein n=1 Tax=Thielaviopsis punctulata TaxID=72032 RepID=A0A0F4ZBZ5_9PEZI|nr:hypothetical protein TD95_001232 [Thielaviopsis punctulata]